MPIRRRSLRAVVLSCLATVLAACGASPCEQWRAWRNASATACQACQTMNCSMETRGVVQGPLACAAEFACTNRCPLQSATTCGCVEACLPTADCRTRFDALIACAAAHCDMECR